MMHSRSRLVIPALFLATTSLAVPLLAGCETEPTSSVETLTDAGQLRVEQVTVDGLEIRFQLAQPLSEAALVGVTAEIDADGPDPSTDELVQRTLVSTAHLEDDGFVLVLTSPEALSPSLAYEARLRLVDSTDVSLGEIVIPRVSARAATVRVTSINPKDDQGLQAHDPELRTPVARDLDHLTIKFSAPIHCGELKRLGRSALRIYTGTGDNDHPPGQDHDMYHDDSLISNPISDDRGHLECSADSKTVKFFPPGRFYGGTKYRVRLRVPIDTQGNFAQAEDFMFKTMNPGIRVKTHMVMNKMDGKNEECDGALFNTNRRRCDTYIVMVGASANPVAVTPRETSSTLGTWDNWLISDWKEMDHTWFETPGPIGNEVWLVAAAFDEDGNDKAANYTHVTAAVHDVVAGALSAAGNPWAALPGAVGAILHGVAEAIRNNDDDNLGRVAVQLTASGENHDPTHVAKWWGMYRDKGTPADPNHPYGDFGRMAVIENKFGEILLFYTVKETPRSWSFIGEIL